MLPATERDLCHSCEDSKGRQLIVEGYAEVSDQQCQWERFLRTGDMPPSAPATYASRFIMLSLDGSRAVDEHLNEDQPATVLSALDYYVSQPAIVQF